MFLVSCDRKVISTSGDVNYIVSCMKPCLDFRILFTVSCVHRVDSCIIISDFNYFLALSSLSSVYFQVGGGGRSIEHGSKYPDLDVHPHRYIYLSITSWCDRFNVFKLN